MMKFQRPFDNSDLDAFLITKGALGIGEYQLFLEAYHAWYGHPANNKQIDALFGSYLHTMELPFFVRHYSRHYLNEHPEAMQAVQEGHHRDARATTLAFSTIVMLVLGALALV